MDENDIIGLKQLGRVDIQNKVNRTKNRLVACERCQKRHSHKLRTDCRSVKP